MSALSVGVSYDVISVWLVLRQICIALLEDPGIKLFKTWRLIEVLQR